MRKRETKEEFRNFIPSKENEAKARGTECVIYNRVSSKDQESNSSLETQMKNCLDLAKRRELTVVETFGGSYESAKTDERKEFNKMLTYVKRRKTIGYILVYAYDRFSRSGVSSISINSNLMKEYGVVTLAATQEIQDPTTPEGEMQQIFFQMYANYENQIRRKRSVDGMKAKLEKNHWFGTVPVGYKNLHAKERAEDHKIVITEEGKLLKQAFRWKHQGISNVEISSKLEKLGLKLNRKRLSVIFQSTFYCGVALHSLAPNGFIEGSWERIVSREMFMAINQKEQHPRRGVAKQLDRVEIPLRRFMICANCGNPFTAYMTKKKLKTVEKTLFFHYYKCNTKGCKVNKNANGVHESFTNLLESFRVEPKYHSVIVHQFVQEYNRLNKVRVENKNSLENNLNDVQSKIDGAEEKYFLQELSSDIYNKYMPKYRNEKEAIIKELKNYESDLSNLKKHLEYTLYLSTKMSDTWSMGTIEEKKQLQDLVFPEGIVYEAKNNIYRTSKIHWAFSTMGLFSKQLQKRKKGQKHFLDALSLQVTPQGLEPRSDA